MEESKMAEKSICTVERCEKTAFKNGMCLNHSWRFERYGNPLHRMPKAKHGEPLKFIREVALAHAGNECLIWPFARNPVSGYAVVYIDGKLSTAFRVVCEMAHGPAPDKEHEAAHECDNGNLGCVSPHHLSWQSHAANHAGTVARGNQTKGEDAGPTVLTENDVRRIRTMLGHKTQEDIASIFGVTREAVSAIKRGRSWAWLK
jgi:hypothetical protein